MKEFEIEIEEKLQRVIRIKAKNKEEAIRKIKEMYRREEIVLDESDFKNVKFK